MNPVAALLERKGKLPVQKLGVILTRGNVDLAQMPCSKPGVD